MLCGCARAREMARSPGSPAIVSATAAPAASTGHQGGGRAGEPASIAPASAAASIQPPAAMSANSSSNCRMSRPRRHPSARSVSRSRRRPCNVASTPLAKNVTPGSSRRMASSTRPGSRPTTTVAALATLTSTRSPVARTISWATARTRAKLSVSSPVAPATTTRIVPIGLLGSEPAYPRAPVKAPASCNGMTRVARPG